MKKLLKISSALLTFSTQAHAMIVGSYMDEAALPESTCNLMIETKDSNDLVTCSATLISPTKILTATHCFEGSVSGGSALPDQMSAATLVCQDSRGSIHVSKLDPEEFMFSLERKVDITLAELDQPIIGVSPMKVATDSEIAEIMRDSTLYECAAIGYGRDNHNVMGNKNGVLITTPLQYESDLTIQFSQKTDLHPSTSLVQKGDSGGTLACQIGGVWKLIGVNVRVTVDSMTEIATISKASVISMEKLYAMRAAVKADAPNRILEYSRKKQMGMKLGEFSNESLKVAELHQAGYSLSDLVDSKHSIKYVAKKTGATFTDFIQAGLNRKKVISELTPTFPRYLNPFKPGEDVIWGYTDMGLYSKRNDAIPCSTIQTKDLIFIYDAETKEIRDDKTNSEHKNRRVFNSRSAAEDYLIQTDPRCFGKGIRTFVEKNRISLSELKEEGMSDHLIQLMRNLSPKTTQEKKPVAQASLKQHSPTPNKTAH